MADHRAGRALARELGFRLLAITPPDGPVDPAIVAAWRDGAAAVGVAVLVREPGTEPAALASEAHRLAPLRRACTGAGVPWILSVDPARLSALDERVLATPGLAGVQLRGDPAAGVVEAARRRLGPARVLGRSCHGTPAPLGVRVDYSVLAPIYAPRTTSPTPGPGKQAVGLDPLRAFSALEPRVFALGGITPSTARACVEAGAYGLASIRSFFGPPHEVADDVARLARALLGPSDEDAPDADPPPRPRARRPPGPLRP
jgi:thiamine monophosphate synthase